MLGVPRLTLRMCSAPEAELDLIPAEVNQLRHSQAVPVSHEDHGGIPVPPAVLPRCFLQAFDFRFCQVLAAPQLAVGEPLWGIYEQL